MRLLGRILVEARKNCGNQNASLKDVLIPSNFDMLMKCARDIGGYEENDGTSSKRSFKSPSTTINCGYEIRNAASVIESQALHEREMNKVEEIGVFIRLYENEWHNKVTTPAHHNLALKKHNRPSILPVTEDLLAIRNYNLKEIALLTEKVEKSPTTENWRNLAESTLTRLIMFNKRRGNYTNLSVFVQCYSNQCKHD